MLLVDFIIFYNSSLCIVCSFLSSFFPKKEERKGSKERRKKRVRTYRENSLKKHERILGCKKGCFCGHFYKNARTHSHFRDIFPFFAWFNIQWRCGSNSAVFMLLKTASRVMRACFLCAFPYYHGLSFFFLQNAKHSCVSSSFFLERRKKNAKF